MRTPRAILTLVLLLGLTGVAGAADKCREGASALSDAKAIAGVRGAIARTCPCDDFDGASKETGHGAFVRCAKGVIADAMDGTPLLGTFTLRSECKKDVKKVYSTAACGFAAGPSERVTCCEAKPSSGKTKGLAKKPAKCVELRERLGRAHDLLRVTLRRRCLQLRGGKSVRLAGRAGDRRHPERRRAGEHAGQPGRRRQQSEAPRPVRRPSFTLESRALHALPSRRPGAAAGCDPDPGTGLRGRRGRLQDPRREHPAASARPPGSSSRCGASTGARTSSRTSSASTSPRSSRVPRSRSTGSTAAS